MILRSPGGYYPKIILIIVMEDVVELVSRKNSGSPVSGDTDSEALQEWILKFGEDSEKFCTRYEFFIYWLSNHNPLWVAYCHFMPERLIAPDNHPGVFPVSVGETWWRLFSKCVLRTTGTKATNDCKDNLFFSGLKVGIDRAVHSLKYHWDDNFST